MKKTPKCNLTGLALVLAGSLLSSGDVNAVTLIEDDFSSNTITTNARLRVNAAGSDWVAFINPSSSSLWTVAGGVVSNAATTTDLASEGGLLRVYDVGAASLPDYTTLTFSFDYTVGTGSTLYFHAIGLNDGTLTGSTQLHNTGATGGSIQSQYRGDNGSNGQGDYTGFNIGDGSLNPDGSAGTALAALTGSGNFTQTYDLSTFAGLADINDFQYITMGWASNVTETDGSGAISIDNFKLTAVPEPSAVGLLGLCMVAGALFGRRRA